MSGSNLNPARLLPAEVAVREVPGVDVVQLPICPRRTAVFFWAAWMLTTCGCGGVYDSTVAGSVTLDGKKLSVGTISFHPLAGGPASYAQVNSDGTYAMQTGREQGLKAGEYIVTVEANERPATLRSPDGGPPAVGKRITPPWYGTKQTSGLRYTIEEGRNTINLELTSQAPSGWSPSRTS